VTSAAAALCDGAILAVAVELSEHTRRFGSSRRMKNFEGTTHGVAVRSVGRLELAPKFTQLADADASYLWRWKLDSKGTPYAAGFAAKVIRLDSNGKPATVFSVSGSFGAAMRSIERNVVCRHFAGRKVL